MIDKSITIPKTTYIGQDVEIGKGTIIYPNVTIGAYDVSVVIGQNCIIREGVRIGSRGLILTGHRGDKKRERKKITGGVLICNNVDIGANSIIQRGGTSNTTIGEGTYIGPLCNIGHDVKIDTNCIITGNNLICGYVEIGKCVTISPGSNILNRIKIGDNVFIGIGSLVLHDVSSGITVYGRPAGVIVGR